MASLRKTAGADDADRRAVVLHRAHLDRRGVGAQQDVGVLLDEEGVLHVARGVELRNVQALEALVVRHDLGVILHREAHRLEHLLALALHQRDRVIRPAGHVRRHGNVKFGQGVDFALQFLCLERFQLFRQGDGDGGFQLVRLAPDGLFLLVGQAAHALERVGHFALAAEVIHAQGFQIHHVGDLLQLGIKAAFQGFDLLVHSGCSSLQLDEKSPSHRLMRRTESAVPLVLRQRKKPRCRRLMGDKAAHAEKLTG